MNTPNCVIRIPAKDSYSTSGPTLMGRQAANEGFLNAWFAHSGHSEFWCMARYKEEAQIFAKKGHAALHKGGQEAIYRFIAQNQIHRVKTLGTLYLPGPQVADMAWIRRRNPQALANDFSLVGMTHTSCELSIQDSLANMLTAPVYHWDAQICPSQSVQTMVQRLLDDEAAWLREHLGAARIVQPQLPILPLGVDCDWLDPGAKARAAHRQHWRRQWQLNDADMAVLYMGRLDLRTKANLYPMLDALELAAQQLRATQGPVLTLILAGWFASAWDETHLRQAVLQACPSVRVIFEDGRTPQARQGVWHAADVFTSLVDNIQETFGLTPIEAMAAGLPVVVSDYDGYRESVRDGVDGFRIASCQPAPGQGLGLIDSHTDVMLNYRDYVSQASSLIGLDLAQAANAYVQLALSPDLRSKMGAQGRQRARQTYDWARLIPQYQALFQDLQHTREQAKKQAPPDQDWTSNHSNWGARHPRRSDPFHSFAHYPSTVLHADMALHPGPLLAGTAAQRQTQVQQQLERPIYQHLQGKLQTSLIEDLLLHIAQNPAGTHLRRWHATQGPQPGGELLQHIGWLVKAGLISLAANPDKPAK